MVEQLNKILPDYNCNGVDNPFGSYTTDTTKKPEEIFSTLESAKKYFSEWHERNKTLDRYIDTILDIAIKNKYFNVITVLLKKYGPFLIDVPADELLAYLVTIGCSNECLIEFVQRFPYAFTTNVCKYREYLPKDIIISKTHADEILKTITIENFDETIEYQNRILDKNFIHSFHKRMLYNVIDLDTPKEFIDKFKEIMRNVAKNEIYGPYGIYGEKLTDENFYKCMVYTSLNKSPEKMKEVLDNKLDGYKYGFWIHKTVKEWEKNNVSVEVLNDYIQNYYDRLKKEYPDVPDEVITNITDNVFILSNYGEFHYIVCNERKKSSKD